jgi:hypothetical protein
MTMLNPRPDSTDPASKQERWKADLQRWKVDLRLRKREIALKEREAEDREREHELKRRELDARIAQQRKDGRRTPLVLALTAVVIAVAGNAVVALINSNAQITFEQTKAESERILEIIKTVDPDKAAVNLDFLLKSGLIADKSLRDNLGNFLSQRNPGQGPYILPVQSIYSSALMGREALLLRALEGKLTPPAVEPTSPAKSGTSP